MTETFRNAMRRTASTVQVVTVDTPQGKRGMTISAFMSLSMDPPHVAFAINEKAGLYSYVRLGQRFCINVLSDGDERVARAFAGEVIGAQRFATGNWISEQERPPRLQSAIASIYVTASQVTRHGNHSLIIAEVLDVDLGRESVPLIYGNGQYCTARDKANNAAT